MVDLRSGLTASLRRAARVLSPENRFRRSLSGVWDGLLRLTGSYVTVPLAGQSIRVCVAFRHMDPNYEAEALRLWLRLVRPGDTVWDVGANIGLYTVLTARAVGPTGAVVAWEPAPETYRVLCKHIAANGLDGRCRALQAAVAERDGGTVPFALRSGGAAHPMNGISRAGAGAVVQVPVSTLDGWLARLGTAPRMVKMDIEGAELLALRGAAELLRPQGPRPTFLVAVHPRLLAELGCSVENLLALLAQYQYRSYDLAGNPARPVELAEYLFLPEETADEAITRIRA